MNTQAHSGHDGPVASFELGLRRLRERGLERRAQDRRARLSSAHRRAQAILGALAAVDRVEAALAELAADLGSELGRRIAVSRRLFDGRYQLGLRLAEFRQDLEGRRHDYFSRLHVLLDPRADEGRLLVECRATVHNQDLPATHWEDDLSAEGAERIRAFLEEQLLACARRYCACDELASLQDSL